MKVNRLVVVFGAPDLEVESTFRAGVLGGTVDSRDPGRLVLSSEWTYPYTSEGADMSSTGPAASTRRKPDRLEGSHVESTVGVSSVEASVLARGGLSRVD